MGQSLGILRLTVLAVSLFFFSGAIQAADATTRDGGRYQLMTATVHVAGKDGVAEIRSLFKIDTTTGQTWIFVWQQQADGVMVQEWRPIK